MSVTYIADAGCPLGQVVEGAADVEESHVQPVQEAQALLQGEHGRQARLPLGLGQQRHPPPHPRPQPALQAPGPGRCLPSAHTAAALLPAFQLVLQTHQHLVQEVREDGMEEDEEASPGPRGNPTFRGIHLDHVDILFTQGLVT